LEISALEDALKSGHRSRPIVYPFEPRVGSMRDTVILYCPTTHRSLSEYLDVISRHEEEFSFVLRPIGQDSTDPVRFRGYGFEARPFNYSMTYLNATISDDQIEDGPPSPDSPLIRQKNIISGPGIPNATLLPTQLIQFVRMTDDPFGSLLEVAENFPLYANAISKIPAAQSLTEKIMDKPERLIAGATAAYVNGRLIRTPDVFHILQASLDELRVAQMLREHFGLSKKALNKSIHLLPEGKPIRNYVIDYRSSFMYSLNDIETGKVYQNWTTSLTTIMTKQPGRVRMNLFNVVFFIDPVDPADMKILQWMDEQVRTASPWRYSYFITPRNSTRFGKRVLYAWAHLRLKYGADKAHQFLLAAKRKPAKGEKLKETHFKLAYAEFVKGSSPKWQGLDDLFFPKTRESKHLRRLRSFLEHLGLMGPGLLFNGVFHPGKRGDQNIQAYYAQSIKRVRHLVMAHRFSNASIDTLDAMFTGDDVFSRHSPLIQHTDKSPSEFVPLMCQSCHFQRTFMQWAKTLRYNSTSTNIKFATFWVFVGESLSKAIEARHIAMEVETFLRRLPADARLAYFCDGDTHRIAMNAMPPAFVQDLLQLKGDEITVCLNGRIIRMKGRVIYDWTAEDFEMLMKWERHRSISMVRSFFADDVDFNYEALRDDVDSIDSSFHSQLALYLSLVYGYSSHNGIVRYPLETTIFNEGSPVVMNFDNEDSQLKYSVVLNPFELPFQRLGPIVKYLRDTKAFEMKVYVNFETETKKYPDNLRAFHRYLIDADAIVFDRFDSKTVYSVMPHPPENWMIIPTHAEFDLDNFVPAGHKPGVIESRYRLASILVEGSAVDEQYVPVHGLRIMLEMGDKGTYDSLSIKTMGYFQLQSQPGVWKMTLGEGPSQIVYNISSVNVITVASFVPSWVSMQVHRNEGMTRFSVYDLPKEHRPPPKVADTIHIFAVVSGRLYEKLVKIMMISAMKNTEFPVHFWFLRNFVSAQFKEELATMSRKYNFSFDFVEYHWPHWVSRQTERHRIIWGNKILFIDGLFPMNLSRVIYIDADAVVRGDLIRLMRADLKGQPYGFVPFCTSRRDMERYHFWTKGYWKRRLGEIGGKRYHISAMFVVDLDRFRRMGAGDRLRKHYAKIVGGSQSLANLDQDLPNDAQDSVPIFSLPRRWLWCCTWCSEFEKDDALIIDLANNPKTKVSKVEMAKQFIEEWPLLNEEAERFNDSEFYAAYNLSKIREEHRKLVGADPPEQRQKRKKPTAKPVRKQTKKPQLQDDSL
jgi:UDP-glucose:glycoprotein glucosyltransferase